MVQQILNVGTYLYKQTRTDYIINTHECLYHMPNDTYSL